MTNTVGVVIATYNGEKYIEEQIQSILDQSIKPDLIIITDGGSKDKTIEICDTLLVNAGINYRILSSNVQLSVKDNFEKGIRECNTDIIFCSDQDDYWLSTKIEDFLSVFDGEQADMVFSDAYITNGNLEKNGKTLWQTIGFKVNERNIVFEASSQTFLNELNRHNVVTGMCMAFKGKHKKTLLPFSDNAIHDVWIAYKMNQIGKIVAFNKPEVLYRQHGHNVIGTQASLKNSMNHKDGYYGRVVSRIGFIEDVARDCKDVVANTTYKTYLEFLSKRIGFMKRTESFGEMLSMISNYIKYEYKWYSILLKDVYTRFTLKG